MRESQRERKTKGNNQVSVFREELAREATIAMEVSGQNQEENSNFITATSRATSKESTLEESKNQRRHKIIMMHC